MNRLCTYFWFQTILEVELNRFSQKIRNQTTYRQQATFIRQDANRLTLNQGLMKILAKKIIPLLSMNREATVCFIIIGSLCKD